LKKVTIKNKYLDKFAKNSHGVLKNIKSSDDPMKELGPGISTYHQFLVMLFSLMVILTCLHIPLMNSYADYNYFDSMNSVILSNSLGNMGFSET
jgi:hypothetical protein